MPSEIKNFNWIQIIEGDLLIRDKNNELYIHLNDYKPDNKIFNQVWIDLEEASKKGITIMIMLGGAGGAYNTFFESNEAYQFCYKLLLEFIKFFIKFETL